MPGREEWRSWLENYGEKKAVVWLVFFKGEAAKEGISYEAAVEEALCFGWIDSIVKKIDEERYARKFTPRKDDSKWSELNKKRANKMIKEGRMTTNGQAKIEAAKKNGRWQKNASPLHSLPAPIPMPGALKTALDNNPQAKVFFDRLAPSYKKQYLGWILSAKREETQLRRIKEMVDKLSRGEKLGLK